MLIDNKMYGILGKYILTCVLIVFFTGCSSLNSKDDSFQPEVSFKKANEMIDKGRYDSAREVLEEIQAKDATRKYALLAKIRIADTFFEDESYEEAAVEYENFLETHTYHKYSSYAQYKLAMSYFKRIKAADISYSWAKSALEEFEKLQRRYPRNPYMNVAENRMKKCKAILADYEYYVGEFYFKKGSFSAAAQRFKGLIENHAGSKREPDALYYLALSYANAGQREKAVHVLESLIEKYPTIELAREANEKIDEYNMPVLILKK